MKLYYNCGCEVIDQPSAEDIARILGEEEDFVILSEAENSMSYLQFSFQEDGGLEYQDGSLERHFRATGVTTPDEVIVAFQEYAAGDGSWKSDFTWERIAI